MNRPACSRALSVLSTASRPRALLDRSLRTQNGHELVPGATAARSHQPRGLHAEARAEEEEVIPFRKRFKDEVKRRKAISPRGDHHRSGSPEDSLAGWELTVGIEIHAELDTARKLFSAAATSISDTPNSHVALFDAALPGTQPAFQKATLLPALRAAIALNCEIQETSSFDRKHYFYQDQPAGYQLTQYYGKILMSLFRLLLDPSDSLK